MKNHHCDIAAITETWLKESIPDTIVNVEGYQLFRRDRKHKEHGGVCLYIGNHIQCEILSCLNEDREVLWAMLRPKRLPRGYSCIIIGVVYHPPDANNNDMLVYLRTSMEYVEANYTNYGIILLGDFNKLDFKRDAKCFQLKPIVKFPTRGSNTLDQIFTNLQEFYCSPVPGPPFGLSDHITVIIFPAIRKRRQTQTKVVKSRDKRPSNVASLGRFLLNIPWEPLLLPHQSSEDKLSLVTQMINYGLNTIMPERSVKVHADDCPWITKDLKRLILQRQKAFTAGSMSLFKLLRNKVNRERKRCRKSYYKAKVQQLSDSKPHDWWREAIMWFEN